VIVFPNCKINLGLNIIRKRNDGFHDLETIFYPVRFFDALEIIDTGKPGSQQEAISFNESGIPVDGIKENNLCIKAYHLLKKDFTDIAPVQMHLHKAIPVGSGLGGGSADGAFTLLLLNEVFHLNLSASQLINYALQLGSDCPFFIHNKPRFATSRGEISEPVNVDLSRYSIVLVNPGVVISTAQTFSKSAPALPDQSIKEIIGHPVATWKDKLKNDFEKIVFDQHPVIKKIKEELYDAGAVYASMSGTGSTVYGIFEKEKKIPLSCPPGYFVKELPG
jgi:4-diphosphocytidyl-2-C-methyl-D-erythritol kinase